MEKGLKVYPSAGLGRFGTSHVVSERPATEP